MSHDRSYNTHGSHAMQDGLRRLLILDRFVCVEKYTRMGAAFA